MLKSQKPRRRAAPLDADQMPGSLAAVLTAALLTFECLPADQLLTVAQVLALIPVLVRTWRHGVRKGIFPAGVRVSHKSVFGRVGDIRALLQSLKS